MNRQRKTKLITYICVAIICMAFIVGAVVRCALLIMDNYTNQLKQSLSDVSDQYAATLSEQVETRYNLLQSVAVSFEKEGENRNNIIDNFVPVVESFGLKRLGIVDKDGTVHATDGSGSNVMFRDFFKRSISGDTYISDILIDSISDDKEKIIVMSMPLHNNSGEIDGIAGLTYKLDSLSDELSIKSFEGYGDNFVINHSGEIVVSSNEDILPVYHRVTLADIKITDHGNSGNVSFAETIVRESYMDGMFEIKDKEYYFIFTPVEIMENNSTWYILSVVPSEYLMLKFWGVQRNLYRMIAIVMLVITVTILGTRYFFRNQRRLTYKLAYTSPVTGGANLPRFLDNMKSVKRGGYIIFMNLEDFTHTSVATGIEKSNELVKIIWDVIKNFMKYGEYAGHDHIDTFVLYFNERSNVAVEERLNKLRDLIHEAGHENNIPWVFPKFGVCRISEENDVKTAYSKAEYTSYDTWGSTKFVSFYSEEDYEKQTLNKNIEEYFEIALEEERFEVWYQPKYSISGEKMTGAEALVRWRKRDGMILPPGAFIPRLEKNGEIARLDEYVFEHTCRQIREWKDKGYSTVPVSINVSRATFYRDKVVETYMSILSKYNLKPSDVQIEVTETILGGNDNILDLLTKFRENGIKILMDDFGSGYSSLSTLNMRCFDTLKIDKSLVDEILNDYGRIIINQTIELGNELGLYITVEGVEDKQQIDILHGMKCNDIQGYFFSKPLPAAEFEEKIK